MKAMGADKEDEMKKAQGRFVKRLIAALIVFLIPSMLNFIFTSLVSIDVDFASCWTDAKLTNIERDCLIFVENDKKKLKKYGNYKNNRYRNYSLNNYNNLTPIEFTK